MEIFKVLKSLAGRDTKVKRLAALKAERQTKLQPLRQAVKDAEEEQRRLKDILNGVFITRAQKNLTRAAEPFDREITSLLKELQEAPPAVIATFLEDCAKKIETLRTAKDAPPRVLKQNRSGDVLEAEKYDFDAIDAAIEALRRLMTLARELSLEPLSEKELAEKIERLRTVPLPEIKMRRFQREAAREEFEEVEA